MERSAIRDCAPRYRAAGSLALADTAYITRPIGRQDAAPHILMKRRMWPIAHTFDEPMLDWIEMDVVDVSGEVCLIPHRVLPESPLPQRKLAAVITRRYSAVSRDPVGEERLDTRHLPEKSVSPGGSVITACRWSGSTTIASKVNGRSRRATRNASRKVITRSTSVVSRRSASVTVKKNVPPSAKLRRYRTMNAVPTFRLAPCGLRGSPMCGFVFC